jgi:hypothetical protein
MQPMRNLFCLLVTALITFSTFAQIKSTIIDSTTKEPIPYVNISVQGEKNIEFSADENGSFTLPEVNASAEIVLSAVGYANTTLGISEIRQNILLTPKPIELAEVVIGNKKGVHSFVVNPVKKAKHTFMGAGGGTNGSLLHATYIPYKVAYAATPYIDKIRLKTGGDFSYTFNVRLQAVNEDGSPGDYLHNENILVKVKKGQKYADIDFSKTHLTIPEEGIFIAIEHIAIKENRLSHYDDGSNFPAHLYAYGPTFLCEIGEDQMGWSYNEGKWKRYPKTEKGYSGFVIEMTLTD